MMPKRISTTSLLAALSLLGAQTGCRGTGLVEEISDLACRDGEDNDGDGPADCDDPGCQHLERCRLRDLATAGAGGPPVGQPGASCATGCRDGERCVLGVCLPQDFVIGDLWEITSFVAHVPRSTRYGEGECLDVAPCSPWAPVPPFSACGCAPDPAVTLYVDGEDAGRTQPVINADSARWDLALPLLVARDSTIRVEVLDFDLTESESIFGCSWPADPELLGRGSLVCEAEFLTDDGLQTFSLTATVRPAPAPL
jgi:hypothetical protein